MNSRKLATIVLAGTSLIAGAAFAGGIQSRNSDEAYNDLMRNYGAAASSLPNKGVMTRSVETAHADLVRDWNAKSTGEPQKGILSQSEKDLYKELIRASFPLSQYTE
jgi:hypothetical protein